MSYFCFCLVWVDTESLEEPEVLCEALDEEPSLLLSLELDLDLRLLLTFELDSPLRSDGRDDCCVPLWSFLLSLDLDLDLDLETDLPRLCSFDLDGDLDRDLERDLPCLLLSGTRLLSESRPLPSRLSSLLRLWLFFRERSLLLELEPDLQ